jgi:DNA-binding transcriptional MerR regulator
LDDERYSLTELAEAAGVSARTVRYYITEGLLSPPVMGGHRSYYGRAHLDRLIVIGLLKDAFWPLREIRKRIASVDDADLPGMIAQLRSDADDQFEVAGEADAELAWSGDALESPAPLSSASEYLRFAEQAPAVSASLRRKSLGSHAPAPPPAPEERRWRRIAINSDAELTVADDLYLRKRERIDALIEWARRVLGPDEH